MIELKFGKIVNNTYITPRRFGVHFLKKLNGFGISEEVLFDLQHHNVKNVIIRTVDCDKIDYLFTLDQYLNGQVFDNQTDKGFDRQKFVNINESL